MLLKKIYFYLLIYAKTASARGNRNILLSSKLIFHFERFRTLSLLPNFTFKYFKSNKTAHKLKVYCLIFLKVIPR